VRDFRVLEAFADNEGMKARVWPGQGFPDERELEITNRILEL
jgi:hypothetical protein